MAITLTEWAIVLHRASGALQQRVASALVNTALDAEAEAKRRVTGKVGPGLKVRTGRLRASIAGSVRTSGSGVRVQVQAGGRSPNKDQLKADTTSAPGTVRYARIHEEGGTITAKDKLLAIPVHKSLFTAAGRPRYAGPRSIKTLDVAVGKKSGLPYLYDTTIGRFPAMYLLRKSVNIPPRPYLGPGLRTAALQMDSDIYEAIESLLEGGPALTTAGT